MKPHLDKQNAKIINYDFNQPRQPFGWPGFVVWLVLIILCCIFWTYILKTIFTL